MFMIKRTCIPGVSFHLATVCTFGPYMMLNLVSKYCLKEFCAYTDKKYYSGVLVTSYSDFSIGVILASWDEFKYVPPLLFFYECENWKDSISIYSINPFVIVLECLTSMTVSKYMGIHAFLFLFTYNLYMKTLGVGYVEEERERQKDGERELGGRGERNKKEREGKGREERREKEKRERKRRKGKEREGNGTERKGGEK